MKRWVGLEDAQRYGREILAGEVSYLRPLREGDLEALERWWSDPAVTVLQTNAVRPQPVGTVAGLFREWSANGDSTGVGFSVVARDGDELIGHVVLYGATVAARSATAAIMIGPEYGGRGYGTDAMRTLVRYGFEELGLRRIGLEAWSFNARTLATYERVGFVEEGRRREVVFHGGHFYDQVLLGLLEREWRVRSGDQR